MQKRNFYQAMNKKIDAVLIDLEDQINKIKDQKDKTLSLEALKGPFFDYRKRYKSDLQIISQVFKKGKILEIGSSPYHLTYSLKKLGFEVVGVDINPNILKQFQRKHKLTVIKLDIEKDKLPFKDNQFDLIVFSEVFEHLRINPLGALNELYRVLKPNGVLMLTTPNLYALHKIIRFNLGRSFNNPYDEFKKVEIFGYMGHIREYSNREIRDILTRCGFTVHSTIFRKFDDFVSHPYLHSIIFRLPALLLDQTMLLFPQLKPFQVVISTKKDSSRK